MFRPHILLGFLFDYVSTNTLCSTMFRPHIVLDFLFVYVSTTHYTRLFVRRCFDHTLHSTFCSTTFRPHIVLHFLFDFVSTIHCTQLFVRLCFDHTLCSTMFRPHIALDFSFVLQSLTFYSSTMCGVVEQKRVCVVETSSNKKSSAMCGRNINEQKVEYNVWST